MSRQRRRTAASALVLAALVAGLALPAAAQATELVPGVSAPAVTEPVLAPVVAPVVPPVEEVPPVVEPEPEPEPETPTVPSVPSEEPAPEVPGVPSQPEQPTTPSEPEPQPSTPTQPEQPAPAQPTQPNQPTQPSQPNQPAQPAPAQPQAPAGGNAGGTATTEAGTTAPRPSAPGRTLLSTSAADPAAAPAPVAEGQPVAEAAAPAVSVYLTRDAGVDPGALTVDLARFYGVGAAYAGFQRGESATGVLRAPDGTETPLTGDDRQDGATTSTGSATVPASALSATGEYAITVTGDRGSTASTTFSLVASTGPGVLVEPRDGSGAETGAPRGAVWGFDSGEAVTIAAVTPTGVKADLAVGALSVRVDDLGWSDLVLGDAIVATPTAPVYCLVATGTASGRTAAVTVGYPVDGVSADLPDAAQVCGIAIATAGAEPVLPSTEASGQTAGVALTIGAGALVAVILAIVIANIVIRRRREYDDLFIGGPLPHPTQE